MRALVFPGRSCARFIQQLWVETREEETQQKVLGGPHLTTQHVQTDRSG